MAWRLPHGHGMDQRIDEHRTDPPADPGCPAERGHATPGGRPHAGAAIGLVSLAVVAGAVAWLAGASPDPMGPADIVAGHRVTLAMAILMAGGAFVILRAAISHDHFSRRFEALCRELESSNARLQDVSYKDDVTGLYNRRFFATRLDEEVSRYCRFAHPVSVVLLDVDRFKAVNDERGHGAGDETLRGIGDILRRNSRSLDVICRYGGDEFAVLLPETGKEGALLYAERVRQAIERAAFPHGRAVTVSAGVGCLPEDTGPVPEDVVTTADWALYEAKRAGKNMVAERGGAVQVGRGRRGGWAL